MKKMMAVLVSVMMILSLGVNSMAAELDFMDNMKNYKSYEGTMEFYIQVNKPLEVLSLFNEEFEIDLKYFVEEAAKMKITADIQAEMSDDALAGKMYFKLNMKNPFNISEDLKINTDITLYMWMDYDFTSAEKAKCNVIVKNPLDGKYMYINAFEAISAEEKAIITETLKGMDIMDNASSLAELMKSVYEGNADIKVERGGYTTVTFTNDALVDMFADVIKSDVMENYLKEVFSSMVIGFDMPSDADIDVGAAMVKGLGIFADKDAYTVKYKTNFKNYVVEVEEQLHVDFNIVELCAAFGLTEADLKPLTKENSNIDITLGGKVTYDKINQKGIVTIPALTEENSVNMMEEMAPVEEEWTEEDYSFESETFTSYVGGSFERGVTYINMTELADDVHYDSDNTVCTSTLSENGDVEITIANDYTSPVKITGNLNSDVYKLNGVETLSRKPFTTVEGYNWETYEADTQVCMSIDILANVLEFKIERMSVEFMDYAGNELAVPEYSFTLVRPNKGYKEVNAEAANEIEELLTHDYAAAVGIIGGSDGPTTVFVTE